MSSGTGSTHLYFVEARLTGKVRHADVVNGVLLSREWTRLPTEPIPATAPIEARRIAIPSVKWPTFAAEHGLLERDAAYAFAVRFQVESGDDNPYSVGRAILCIETRLVEVVCRWSYEIAEVGVCAPVSLFDQLRYLKSVPREQPESDDEVDPQAASTGTPSTREKGI